MYNHTNLMFDLTLHIYEYNSFFIYTKSRFFPVRETDLFF